MNAIDNRVQTSFRRYLKQSLWMIVGMALVVLAFMSIKFSTDLVNALIVTVLF